MNIKVIEADQLKSELADEQSILLDIREEYEYEDDHLESLHIPMAQVKSRVRELVPYSKIVICCKSGNRAQAIAYTLSKNLLDTEISYLNGGMQAYREIYAKD